VDGGLVVLSTVVVGAVVAVVVGVVVAVVVGVVVAVVVGLSCVVGVTRVDGLLGVVVVGEFFPLDPLVRTSTRMMTTMTTRTPAAMAIHMPRLLFFGR
jgi:hypothetical protein